MSKMKKKLTEAEAVALVKTALTLKDSRLAIKLSHRDKAKWDYAIGCRRKLPFTREGRIIGREWLEWCRDDAIVHGVGRVEMIKNKPYYIVESLRLQSEMGGKK